MCTHGTLLLRSSAHGRIRLIKVRRAATTCSGARGCFRWNLIHASFSTPRPVRNAAQSHASSRRQTNWTQSNKLSSPCCRENTCQCQSTNMKKQHPRQDNYKQDSLLATSCIKSNELTNLKMPMHTWYTYLRKCLTNKTTKQNHEPHELLDLITLFHLIVNITFASCNSSRIERDNCCQRERSGGKDIPPIRNRMHQVKLHQTAWMANRVRWIRSKLQVIVDFSARFGKKSWRLDIVKTFNDQLHLKTWYAVYFWKNTFYMEKTQ